MSVLEKLSFTLNSWIEYLLFGLGFTMTVVVAVQVFFRYVLNQSLFWSEELALSPGLAFIFGGLGGLSPQSPSRH